MKSIKNFEDQKIDLTNHTFGGALATTTRTCWEDTGCVGGMTERYYQVTSDDGVHLNSYTLMVAGVNCDIT